jgi:glucose/arabinose dehydrogenase
LPSAELGPNLVPDYLISVKDGAFYGWPYSYYGQHIDPRVQPQRPDLVEKAIVPDYGLSSHVAPLGLVFYAADSLPQKYRGGAFVGEHGSWDRPEFNGYRVVFVPFSGGRPNGKARTSSRISLTRTARRAVALSESPSTRAERF